jgi:hypothetical protein
MRPEGRKYSEKVVIVGLDELLEPFSRAESVMRKAHACVVKLPQSVGDRDPLRPQWSELRVKGEQLLNDR